MFSEWSPKARWSVHQGCGAKAPTLSLGGSSTSSLCPLPPSLAHSPPAPRFGAGAGRDCAHSCVHRWSPEGSLQCLQGSALSLEVPTCSWEHEAEQQEKAHDRLRRRPRREKIHIFLPALWTRDPAVSFCTGPLGISISGSQGFLIE